MIRNLSFCVVTLLAAACSDRCQAQPFSGDSYANLYSWQLGTSGQALTPQTYLWDRYYYNNPNISPYLNLMRAQPYGGTDYFTYVKPLEEERERQDALAAKRPPTGGRPTAPNNFSGGMYHPSTSYNPYYSGGGGAGQSQIMPYSSNAPNRSASYYYNHYYGGWQGRN